MTGSVAFDGRSVPSHVWKHSSARVQYRLHTLRWRGMVHAAEQQRQRARAH
jgi:hypothetical protein